MVVLDQVMQLKKQGMDDQQIQQQLSSQGISQRDISEAINQAKIKGAVGDADQNQQEQQNPQGQDEQDAQDAPVIGQEQPPQGFEGMEQSIMQEQQEQQPEIQQNQQGQQNPQEQQTPQGQPPQEYQQPYPTQQYQEYYPQQSLDTDTISEITEQILAEKLSEIKEKIQELSEFKNSTQDKLSDLDFRLKRIETSIDKMQYSILGKIGEFGESTQAIHQDLDNLHGTVSKLMNPLIDNYKELKKITENPTKTNKNNSK